MGGQYRQLGAEERGAIAVLRQGGYSASAIARKLDRARSTITREIKRHGIYRPGRPWGRRVPIGYEAERASVRAGQQRQRARRPRKLRDGQWLWSVVQARLARYWSPQQIARTLRAEHPATPAWHVSHQTIYTAIYAMPRGGLKRCLARWLRRQRSQPKPRHGPERRGRLPDLPSIHTRPSEVEDRILPGHWEGDLIIGARNASAIGTLVERTSRWVMVIKLDSASAEDVLEGYSRSFNALPEALRKTLTYDQGKEMALHRRLSQRTGLKIYFADPHSPWQRGMNENTNGLLRQYLPKGRDLSVFSQRQLNEIADSLNTRPRQTLNWRTPQAVFYQACNWAIPTWKPMSRGLQRLLQL